MMMMMMMMMILSYSTKCPQKVLSCLFLLSVPPPPLPPPPLPTSSIHSFKFLPQLRHLNSVRGAENEGSSCTSELLLRGKQINFKYYIKNAVHPLLLHRKALRESFEYKWKYSQWERERERERERTVYIILFFSWFELL